ncbi:MAG: histidine phosphatase family protein [bacterium]|nr:histidine phosphatase family protein [bacterium]
MELTIIRHGQSVNNALNEDQVLRVFDPELTEIGKQQAACTADYLKTGEHLEKLVMIPLDSPERAEHHPYQFTHLYCSAMHRAMQTAQPIASAVGLKPSIWLDIHEHGGIYLEKEGVVTGYGGRTRLQILEEFPDYVIPDLLTDEGWWNPVQGKEDYAGASGRAIRVASELRQRALNEATAADRIILVSHGTFIDALIKALLFNLPNDRYFHWHYNCAMTRLDLLNDGRVLVRYINRVSHLPKELITT